MAARKKPATPQAWVDQIFQVTNGAPRPQVVKGGVLRRSKSSVGKQNADAALRATVKTKGFFLFENANEYIILCGNNLNLIKL